MSLHPNSDPRGQMVLAVLMAVASTVVLVLGDLDGSTRRLGIPYAVLIPLGYVIAAVLGLNAVRLWRRQRR